MKKIINFFKSLFTKKVENNVETTKSIMEDVSDRLEVKATNKKKNNRKKYKNVNGTTSSVTNKKNNSRKKSKSTTGDTPSVNNELEEVL
jgi:hypothetical protein